MNKYKNTNTAYYLSYRKINKNEKKLNINDMIINNSLRLLCKDENDIIIKNEKIEEEKRKFQKIGINPNKEYTFHIFIEIKNNKNIEGQYLNEENEEYEFKKNKFIRKK